LESSSATNSDTDDRGRQRPRRGGWRVKLSLMGGQIVRLLCVGGESNLSLFDQFNQRRTQMTNENLTIRVAQALLAVTATVASVLAFQFALLTV
jgi:hypothetical protein